MKILIVEDELELSKNMVHYLKSENYHCDTAADFQKARQKIESFAYDCILLDVSLPGGNGLTLLKELKKDKKTDGVIIISAKDSISDRISGLNLGADDYLTKPFHLSELNARISAVIRRRRFDGQNILVLGDLVVDVEAKTVMVNDKPIDVTRKEYELLLFLASNKNRVISKHAIAEHLSGSDAEIFDNYDFIYTHIKNVKRKIISAGGTDCIRSIYGMGYKLEVR